MADVGADMLKRIGMNVDYQATDWSTLLTRRAKKDLARLGYQKADSYYDSTKQLRC